MMMTGKFASLRGGSTPGGAASPLWMMGQRRSAWRLPCASIQWLLRHRDASVLVKLRPRCVLPRDFLAGLGRSGPVDRFAALIDHDARRQRAAVPFGVLA